MYTCITNIEFINLNELHEPDELHEPNEPNEPTNLTNLTNLPIFIRNRVYLPEILYPGKVDNMKMIIRWIGSCFLSCLICSPLLAQQNQINLIENAINGYQKQALGSQINTGRNEVLPIISPSGRYLFFARYDREGSASYGRQNEDIWFSSKMLDGSWEAAREIGSPLNNNGSNAVISISIDENTLFLANRYDDRGKYIGGGLSVAQRTKHGWSLPAAIRIEKFYNKSKIGAQNFCFSANRKVMIMSVQRDDTYGSVDLYVSFLQENGVYSRPRNMGEMLNSEGVEYAPFLAADGQTLYFASDGHPGYGDSDIFVSRRLDNSWTRWSMPLNLGPEVNGEGADAFYTVPARGDFAYMSSRNPNGDSDIYRIPVPPSARPNPTLVLYGVVKDQVTYKPLVASIQFFDRATGEVVGEAQSAPGDGSYQFVLPQGKQYVLRIDRKGYYVTTEEIDLVDEDNFREMLRNLYLMPGPALMERAMEEGITIFRVDDILFEHASADLKEDSEPVLDRLANLLKDRPEIRIEVQGHTDNTGTPTQNMALSEARARSVIVSLISRGIAAERVASKGFGESQPVAPNNTEEGRAKNRRVEIKIIRE